MEAHSKNLQELQKEKCITFGNKLSKSNIFYHRQKMLSSSVSDASEFLLHSGHPLFSDGEGTIEFIRAIDKMFDILNSRIPFGKRYKQPYRLSNENYITNSIDDIIEYLLSFRVLSGQIPVEHRRNCRG